MTELEKKISERLNSMENSQLTDLYRNLNREPIPGPLSNNLRDFIAAICDKQAAESGQPTTSEAKDYFN